MSAEVKFGYKLTELGVIPEEWSCCSVEQLVSDGILEKPMDGNHGNIHPKSSDFVSDGIPFVMANNIKDGSVDLRNCSFIRKSQADNLQKGFSKPGDVLLTHKATIGQVAIVGGIETDYIMLTPQVTYYRVANTNLLDNIYLRHFFESDVFQRVLQSLSGGGTRSYIGITAQRLLPVLLPPLAEQITIARCLSDIDALINCLNQLIAKKRNIKQASTQQLLTGQQRLPGFSGEWEVKRLGDLASFLKGKGLPKSELTPYGADPCIHYGELFTLYPETIGEVISRTNGSREAFRSIANDVLMPTSDVTPRGLAKASCVTVDGVILGGDILVIRSDSKQIDGSFLSYVIRRHEDQVLQLVTGSTVFHLYGSDMKKFTFSMPPVLEQTAIANILSDMDTELDKLESRRQKAHQLKQGMMQELLTGRIRLR